MWILLCESDELGCRAVRPVGCKVFLFAVLARREWAVTAAMDLGAGEGMEHREFP
jgi:hypothetical protein